MSGEDALARHKQAQALDRVEGDAQFQMRSGGSGSNPNAIGEGGPQYGLAGRMRIASPQGGQETNPADVVSPVSKKRTVEAPGERHGNARDPILGQDGTLHCNNAVAPNVSAASRAQMAERGFVRADLPSEGQPGVVSPCSRKRHVAVPTTGLIG